MSDEAEEARRKAINARFLEVLGTEEGRARMGELAADYIWEKMLRFRKGPLPPIDLHLDEQKKKEDKE